MPSNGARPEKKATLRVALWQANDKKCFYCQEPIIFTDLEIDHLLPAVTPKKDLARFVEAIGLPNTFQLSDSLNLVPSHHTCNGRKSKHRFSEKTLRFYYEIWQKKQPRIEEHLKYLQGQAIKDKLLTDLVAQIDNGFLSSDEVVSVLRGLTNSRDEHVSDPLVICFGLNLFDKTVKRLRTSHEMTVDFMERLEKDLLIKLRRQIRRPIAQIESERTGETISVRIALWDSDLDQISEKSLMPWAILEAVPYSAIYSESPNQLFPRAVEESYNIFLAEARGCPRCGGKVTIASSSSESGEFAIATCQECGWEQYHPTR